MSVIHTQHLHLSHLALFPVRTLAASSLLARFRFVHIMLIQGLEPVGEFHAQYLCLQSCIYTLSYLLPPQSPAQHFKPTHSYKTQTHPEALNQLPITNHKEPNNNLKMNTSALDFYDRLAFISGSFLVPIADYITRDVRDERIYRFKRRGSDVDLEWCELPEEATAGCSGYISSALHDVGGEMRWT